MPALDLAIPEEVRRRARLRGPEGAKWLAGLGVLVEDWKTAWGLSIESVMRGGSAALVLAVRTSDGLAAALKLPAPWVDPDQRALRVLLAADGRGHAKVLRHDERSGIMLLERLGAPLSSLGLDVDAQIKAIRNTLLQAWFRPADPTPFTRGDRKASELADFIESTWRTLGEPCSTRVIDQAQAFARERAAAFDPNLAVLAHGDAHADNLLQDQREGSNRAFKLVDPEGLFIEPAYDLSASMRDWSAELLEGDPLALGQRRRDLLAQLTGIDPKPIWQWGFIERVSTGLHLLELGWEAEAIECLAVAEAWA